MSAPDWTLYATPEEIESYRAALGKIAEVRGVLELQVTIIKTLEMGWNQRMCEAHAKAEKMLREEEQTKLGLNETIQRIENKFADAYTDNKSQAGGS